MNKANRLGSMVAIAEIAAEIAGQFDLSSEQTFSLGKICEKYCLDEDGRADERVWVKLIEETGRITSDQVLDLLTTTEWGANAFYPFLETSVRFLYKALGPEKFPMETIVSFFKKIGDTYEDWEILIEAIESVQSNEGGGIFRHPHYTADDLGRYALLAKHHLFVEEVLAADKLSVRQQLELGKEICNPYVWGSILRKIRAKKRQLSRKQAALVFESIKKAYSEADELLTDLELEAILRMIVLGFGLLPFESLFWLGKTLDLHADQDPGNPWKYIPELDQKTKNPAYTAEQMALIRELSESYEKKKTR